MFDGARSRVGVLEGNASIVNRVRLLILTDPTELYNEPDFGVGIKKYLWQYNTDNTRARVEDNIREQLRLYEPCCDADDTQFSKGLISENTDNQSPNKFTMTVGLRTILGDTVEIKMDDLQEIIEAAREQIGVNYGV